MISSIGNMMGKPKTAISTALLLAFEAMADTNVNTIARPELPKRMTIIYSGISATIFPNKREYSKKEASPNKLSNRTL